MEIFDKVKNILSELSGMETICLEHELQNDLSLDSLGMVTLLIMLEENFQFVLDESDINPFDLIEEYGADTIRWYSSFSFKTQHIRCRSAIEIVFHIFL